MLAACATGEPAPAPPSGESMESQAIESALPGIAAAQRKGRAREATESYADRSDRAGKLLSAWATPDLQTSWDRLRAQVDPFHPFAWPELGMARIYLAWNTPDQAQQALARAMGIDPNIAEAYVLKAQLELSQGQVADARADDQKALALRPDDPFAFDGLAKAALAQHDSAAARSFFDQARRAWPEDFTAIRGLADLDEAAADVVRALDELDALHKLAPQETALWLESGRLRQKAGDLAGAAHDFEAALERGAHDPDLLALLARTYRSQHRDADERRVLYELVDEKPDAPSWHRLADLDLAAGDDSRALHDYRQAVRADAADVDARLAIARLEAKRGDIDGAITTFREAVAERPAARPELSALEAQIHLAPKPLSGGLMKINAELGAQLNKLYRQLLVSKPALGGLLRLRVIVRKDGQVDQEEFVEDTVGDPILAANLFWNAHDAHFPPADAKYVFKFELKP